jgi:hypothetical protein
MTLDTPSLRWTKGVIILHSGFDFLPASTEGSDDAWLAFLCLLCLRLSVVHWHVHEENDGSGWAWRLLWDRDVYIARPFSLYPSSLQHGGDWLAII